MTRFWAVPSMAAWPAAAAKSALVVVTVATPTSVFSLTIGAACGFDGSARCGAVGALGEEHDVLLRFVGFGGRGRSRQRRQSECESGCRSSGPEQSQSDLLLGNELIHGIGRHWHAASVSATPSCAHIVPACPGSAWDRSRQELHAFTTPRTARLPGTGRSGNLPHAAQDYGRAGTSWKSEMSLPIGSPISTWVSRMPTVPSGST